jgi:hypothetical protein
MAYQKFLLLTNHRPNCQMPEEQHQHLGRSEALVLCALLLTRMKA